MMDNTMRKKRCLGDKDLPEADLIRILLGLPIVSLVRFKAVCKLWFALIESSSSFTDLYFNSSSSSNKFGSFILYAAVNHEQRRFRENALFMLSSLSVSESESLSLSGSVSVSRSGTVSWCSESFGLWSTGFNGICRRCVSGFRFQYAGECSTDFESGYVGECSADFESGSVGECSSADSESGSVGECSADSESESESVGECSGWWWRKTNDGLCGVCWKPHNFDEEDDQVVFKIDNPSFLEGGGGGGGGVSNDDDQQQQQQQHLVLKLGYLGFPSCYQFDDKIIKPIHIVGSCNGLVCLHDSEHDHVYLWNPATRQYRILPGSITFDGDCLHHRLFAFGFDAETKDYKVVLLSGLRLRPRIIDGLSDDGPVVAPMECICRVQVYSLSTDSWRLLEGINVLPGSPSPYPDSSGLLYLNGSCLFTAKFLYSQHWIPPPKDNDRFIISLDLTKEIITPIQLPYHYPDQDLYLCYLVDKIALFTTNFFYCGTVCWEIFYVWVLNEHCSSSSSSSSSGNDKSWTKLHSFKMKHGLPDELIIPRGISNDGVFVFLETGLNGLGNKKKMKLYNLVTQEVKSDFIYSEQVLSNAYAYKPSLVSIIGGNGCCISYRFE